MWHYRSVLEKCWHKHELVWDLKTWYIITLSSLYPIYDAGCSCIVVPHSFAWWHHEMETFPALLALCVGNSPVTGQFSNSPITSQFPSQRSVTRSFDVFFNLPLNKQLSKQWWGWWFETPSHSLWHHCNALNWRKGTKELSPCVCLAICSTSHFDIKME